MYEYWGCGVPSVFLENGYTRTKSPYGEGIVIEDIEGLHDAIWKIIVSNGALLSGEELRFLRTELEFSQAMLGELLGVDVQSIASWEQVKRTHPRRIIAERDAHWSAKAEAAA